MAGASPVEILDSFVRIVRRQFLLVAVVAALGMALGVLYVAITPASYTAETALIVEPNKVRLFQQPTIPQEAVLDNATMESQLQILKSDGVLRTVVEKLDLTEDPEFTEPPPSLFEKLGQLFSRIRGASEPSERAPTSRTHAEMARAAVEALQSRLDVDRAGSSYVIAVRFRSSDPRRAAQIADAVADAYIADQQKARLLETRGTGDWLRDRLQELRKQSLSADQAVIDFKTKNKIVTMKGQLFNDQELADLNSQVVAARVLTSEAKARLDRIEKVISADGADAAEGATVTDALNNPVLVKLRSQYLELSNRLADWSVRFGPNHLAVVDLRRQVREIHASALNEMKRIAETYKSDYAIAKQRQEAIEKQASDALAQLQTANQAQATLRELESTAQAYRSLYDNFLQRYTETVQQESFSTSDARILSRAAVPLVKSQPKTRLILGFAAVASLLAGFGAAALRDMLDRVFRTRKQVESALQADCIAMVPAVDVAKPKKKTAGPAAKLPAAGPRIILREPNVIWSAVDFPYSRFAEEIRSIKLAADSNVGRAVRAIGITSALPNEGKSVIAATLAALVAQAGQSVILVDCDLRNPSLSRQLTPRAGCGLPDVVAGKVALERAVWREPATNMTFLPGSVRSRSAHTSEILAADATKQLFDRLRSSYDYVVVDLPPLAPVVDVRATAGIVDSYAFVVEWGQTRVDVVEQALRTARVVQENLLGIVLSKVNTREISRYEGDQLSYYSNKDFARYGQSEQVAQ